MFKMFKMFILIGLQPRLKIRGFFTEMREIIEMMMMSKAILLISSPATSAAGHGEYNEGDEDESEDYFFTNL